VNYHQLIGPVSRRFRAKRMAAFEAIFGLNDHHSIIDVGGRAPNWQLVSARPKVLLVNVEAEEHLQGKPDRRFEHVIGDGRALSYPDGSFDIAYSNSVIEHVGGWEDQKAFAREIRRVGRGYYVQTPYKHFPLEPHVLTPFAQYFPKRFAKWFLKRLSPHAFLQKPSQQWVDDFVDSTRLLTVREMRELFPDATILREKTAGLTKSLVAYKVERASRSSNPQR
jgi:hypothetical protein